jgi:hypothetical protein
MKVNISDLLDDFTPGQDMDFLDNKKDGVNLKAVKRSVNQRIVRLEGGHFMHYSLVNRIAVACFVAVAVLSIGTITVNAATNGALIKSLRVVFVNENGTEDSYDMVNSYIDENGNSVAEYATKDGGKFSVTINKNGSDNQPSASEDLGIDVEKYNNYEPGTYEETNKKGIEYKIIVSGEGSIDIHRKDSKLIPLQ